MAEGLQQRGGLRLLKESGMEHIIMQVKLVSVHTVGQILDKFIPSLPIGYLPSRWTWKDSTGNSLRVSLSG